jgi:SAM-dependent methyltransferase
VARLENVRNRARNRLAAYPTARRAYHWLATQRARVMPGSLRFEELPPEAAVTLAYQVMLGRDPDPVGQATYVPAVRDGALTRGEMARPSAAHPSSSPLRPLPCAPSDPRSTSAVAASSDPFPGRPGLSIWGGTSLGDRRGALVSLGYPYQFESLVIVDLPSEERHAIYQSQENDGLVVTDKGPVRYRYHSMVDLSGFEDASVDLVYSGQSIEHVHPEEAAVVLKEVYRILRPGGWLGLDTPNGRVTRCSSRSSSTPITRPSTRGPSFSRMLSEAGFEISWAKGLNYAGESLAAGRFDVAEVAGNCRVLRRHRGLLHPGCRSCQARIERDG